MSISPGLARLALLLACIAAGLALCLFDKISGPLFMTAVVGPIIGWAIANASARQAADAVKNGGEPGGEAPRRSR